MQYAQAQRNPAKHSVGFGIVVLLHVVVVYALVTGLARKVVDVIKRPIEAKVIEEIRKPPPPPEVAVPPPPKNEAPPPPFIPPPEVVVQAPPQVQPNTITSTTTTAPTNTAIAPAMPSAPPQPAPVSAGVVCGNYASVMGDVAYPREAIRQGIEKGDAVIQFTVGPTGGVKDIRVVSASHPIFARNSLRIVGEYKCQGQGREVLVQVPFGYRLQ